MIKQTDYEGFIEFCKENDIDKANAEAYKKYISINDKQPPFALVVYDDESNEIETFYSDELLEIFAKKVELEEQRCRQFRHLSIQLFDTKSKCYRGVSYEI